MNPGFQNALDTSTSSRGGGNRGAGRISAADLKWRSPAVERDRRSPGRPSRKMGYKPTIFFRSRGTMVDIGKIISTQPTTCDELIVTTI